MEKNHNSLKSDRIRKTLRDTSLTCDTYDTYKILCLRCGEEFLCNRHYKHISEECCAA